MASPIWVERSPGLSLRWPVSSGNIVLRKQCPPVGFIVTNLARPAECGLAFHKSASNGSKSARERSRHPPACRSFAANANAFSSTPSSTTRQFRACAGNAQGGGALVADQPTGKSRSGPAPKVVTRGRYVSGDDFTLMARCPRWVPVRRWCRPPSTGPCSIRCANDNGCSASKRWRTRSCASHWIWRGQENDYCARLRPVGRHAVKRVVEVLGIARPCLVV